MIRVKRIFLIVIDSMGVGYEPDADKYGDEGACTLKSIRKSKEWNAPNLEKMGLFNISGFKKGEKYFKKLKASDETTLAKAFLRPGAHVAYGKLREKSKGKDTTAGHWEIAGLITPYTFPTFPEGFPREIISAFEKATGRGVLCNKPYSGTDVIRDYGEEQLKTGKYIVYTSADSVFQIAAHEDVIPLEELYEACRKARNILTGEYGVGRVIARPFTGEDSGHFVRDNAARHDFSLLPPKDTALDLIEKAGLWSIGIGKINDIFAGKGLDESITVSSTSNMDGMNKTIALADKDFKGLVFVNLVETDSVYGHRRDIDGYARAVSAVDKRLSDLIDLMDEGDMLMVTADHGCDPGFKGTDHTREYIPLVMYGRALKKDTDLGIRESYADIGSSILELLGIDDSAIDGTSFAAEL